MINLACLKRSSELKWILRIISFQSFIDLIFIELEPNICVFAFGKLSKYCCDALVLWLYCSLKGWKNWSNTSGRLLVNLSKTNKQLFNMILFFNLFILSCWNRGSDGYIDVLKFIILKVLFWVLCIIANVLLWLFLFESVHIFIEWQMFIENDS